MQVLVGEFFSFLSSELPADRDALLESLFASSSLGVFPREALLRLGGSSPPPTPPLFDESPWFPARPAALPWLALEAAVRDDMPLLFFLFSRGLVSAETRAPSASSEYPYIAAGDTLGKFVERFPSFWSKKLLAFWRVRSMASGGGGGGGESKRGSRVMHSRVMAPARRGSYAIMKRDLDKIKDETALLIMVHFGNGTTVNMESSSAKKARHLVYEIGEKNNLDLEAWALKDAEGNFLDDYKSLKQNNVRSGDELTMAL